MLGTERPGLGSEIVSEKPFLEVVDLALPYIELMLDEMCEDGKEKMKELPADQIGSWSKAVTCCDGCWLTRFQSELHVHDQELYYSCPCLLWASLYERS